MGGNTDPTAGLGLLWLLVLVAWGLWMVVLTILIPVMLADIRRHLARLSDQVDRAVNRQAPLPMKRLTVGEEILASLPPKARKEVSK